MKKTVIGTCPVCAAKLKVAKLHCHHCSTSIEGDFELDKFSYLTKEQKWFIEVFVKNRGNIKEIEKELGISYPTVRRNLDQVIEALGYKTQEKKPDIDKKAILEQLDRGEISSEEALRRLSGEESKTKA